MNGISKYYIRKIVEQFAQSKTATETARKLKINRNTVNKYYRIVREAIVDYQQNRQPDAALVDAVRYFSWHTCQGLALDVVNDAKIYALLITGNQIYINEIDSLPTNQSIISIAQEVEQDNFDPLTSLPVEQEEIGDTIMKPTIGAKFTAKTLPDTDTDTSSLVSQFAEYAQEQLIRFYGVKEDYVWMYLKDLEFRFNNRHRNLGDFILRILPHHSQEWVQALRRRR